ncbi:MAG: SPOR domain-containing protein [Rubrivivax sp.]|nr:SPOR domain-containing protein [Rubrivivax sp.]MDH5339158.1 SPOR domain-containing protein [Rubrivivax sp.]
MKFERGGFALGLLAGLLLGLALALGVALYISKVPVPFINNVPQRSAEQDQAEAERNKNWNPNTPLAPNVPAPPATAQPAGTDGREPAAILSGAPVTAPAPAPAGSAVSTAPGPEAFTYLVQVGAFTRVADAEAQRARLAMQGLTAKVSEREQAGRTVYRVRVGPFDQRAEADEMQQRLKGEGIEGQLVRVQRP